MIVEHLPVVAKRDEIGNGRHRAMSYDHRIIQRGSSRVHEELFGRHRFDPDLIALALTLYLDIVNLRDWLTLFFHHLGLFWRYAGHWSSLDRHGFDALFLQDQTERTFVQPLKGMGMNFDAVVPPPLHEAALIHQRVLKHAVEDPYRIVVLPNDVIQIIGRLFAHRHVVRVAWHELDHLLGTKENAHHRRQHSLHGIAHIAADDLGTAIDLVAEGIAAIVFGGFCPDGRDIVVDVLNRVRDVGGNHCLQVGLAHPHASFSFSFVYVGQ